MKADIKRILDKKRPTGDDVGKLILYKSIDEIEHKREHEPPKMLLQEQIFEVENKVQQTEKDYLNTSYPYRVVGASLYSETNMLETYEQQALVGFTNIENFYKLAILSEEERAHFLATPVVLTQQEYDDYKNNILDTKYIFLFALRMQHSGYILASSKLPQKHSNILPTLENYCIDSATQQQAGQIQNLRYFVEDFVLKNLKQMIIYNTMLTLISDFIQVEDLKKAKYDISTMEKNIEIANENRTILFSHIQNRKDKLSEKKLQLYQDTFPEIFPLHLSINEETKKQAQTFFLQKNGCSPYELYTYIDREGGALWA